MNFIDISVTAEPAHASQRIARQLGLAMTGAQPELPLPIPPVPSLVPAAVPLPSAPAAGAVHGTASPAVEPVVLSVDELPVASPVVVSAPVAFGSTADAPLPLRQPGSVTGTLLPVVELEAPSLGADVMSCDPVPVESSPPHAIAVIASSPQKLGSALLKTNMVFPPTALVCKRCAATREPKRPTLHRSGETFPFDSSVEQVRAAPTLVVTRTCATKPALSGPRGGSRRGRRTRSRS